MSSRKVISTPHAPQAIGPYVQAVQCSGSMLFVSGQIPLNPETGEIISDQLSDQAHQVFKNAIAVVEAAGGSRESIVKNGIFIKDMGKFAEINEIYTEYFGETPPARFCVEVSRLPKDVLIEMDCVACLD